MIDKYLLVLFLFFFFPLDSCAQKNVLEVEHPTAIYFWDDLLQRFVVIDDSTHFSSYNTKTKKWDSKPLSFDVGISFNDFLKNFTALTRSKNTPIFIHEGCGLVYEFKNGSIFRIDKSYPHMNQFGGVFFVRNNEPLLFGGYGLFSFKNFITRFGMREKEWFKVVSKEVAPRPRSVPFSIFEDDRLYVLGGLGEQNSESKTFDDGWYFDFKTNRWTYLGQLNSELPHVYKWFYKGNQFVDEYSPNYYLTAERIYRFFPKENRVKIWILTDIDKCISILQHQGFLLVRKLNHTTQEVRFSVELENVFFGKLNCEEKMLFNEKQSFYTSKWMVFLVALIFLVLIYIVSKFSSRINSRVTRANTQQFTKIEKQFLEFLIDRKKDGLEMNAVYDFVNHDNPTLDTLKKRREQLLKELRIKLSKEFQIPVSEVFIEKRLETDKRMKMIFLNPKIQDLYTKRAS